MTTTNTTMTRTPLRLLQLFLALAGLGYGASIAVGQNVGSYGMGTKPPPPSPETLKDLTITEQMQKEVLGKPLPLDGTFYDHNGTALTIRELLGNKPAILVPVYFNCPKLCGQMAQNLIETLRALRKLDSKMVAGEAFQVVLFSIDKKEFPQQAFKKRDHFHMELDGRKSEVPGIWYLSANAGQKTHTQDQASETILELTKAMKFTFVVPPEDKKGREIQHGTAILVLTPTGLVSSYNTELSLDPVDLKKQLELAATGATGTTSSRSSLSCFLGDENPNSPYRWAMRILGWVSVPFLGVVGTVIFLARRRAKNERLVVNPSTNTEGL
jgi:protein SCO1/2